MTTLSLFVQEHGQPAIREVLIQEVITGCDFHAALVIAGIVLTDDSLVYLDEMDVPLERNSEDPVGNLHDGHRVHVCRCRHIDVTVNYLERKR